MKINKYEKKSGNKYRLYLDNGEVIDTYDDVILENNLLIKKELDLSTYNKVMLDNSISDNYNACIKYINVRVRSKKEIIDYLKRKNVHDEDIDKIVSKLLKNKILDDEYFTSCFIKDKLKFTSWGPYKIINELKNHNIDSNIIDKYNYLFDDEEIYLKMERLVDKQIKANHKLDNGKLRNKIYNNLFNSGYKTSMIMEILNDKL